MKNSFFRLTFALIIASVIFIYKAQPSQAAIEQSARRWVCLNAEHTQGHEATLTSGSTAPLPNAETYIFVCIGNDCTTGNSALDIETIGKDGIAALKPLGYHFEGMSPAANPVTTDASGGIGSIKWHDSTSEGHTRIWMALNKFQPQADIAGQAGGQQQGTFTFEAAIAKDCARIAWDPFGRIFDAQTLEPVPGAVVSLLWKNKAGEFVLMSKADVPGGAITNPSLPTDVDGAYSFVVPDGEYKLDVAGGMVKDIAQVNPRYTPAYYEIYPALTDGDDDIIIEKGKAEHRDIPVITANGTHTDPKIFEGRQVQSQGIILVSGRISHPLSKAVVKIKRVYTDGRPDEIREGDSFPAVNEPSDHIGEFNGQINQGTLEMTDEYVDVVSSVDAVKTDLTLAQKTNTLFNKLAMYVKSLFHVSSVNAQAKGSSMTLIPMPSYLEGYAYDSAGKPIPKALVSIYLLGGTKPYYQTNADESGHYKIGSEYVPPMQYQLKYQTTLGQVITVSTEKFLVQNKEYIMKNDIKPFEFKAENKNIITGAPRRTDSQNGSGTDQNGNKTGGGKNGVTAGSRQNQSGVAAVTAALSQPGGQGIMMVIVAIVVLVLVGVGAFVMMKSKQQPQL